MYELSNKKHTVLTI